MDRMDFLPLVKAYPAISQRYGEVSCVAGLRLDTASGRPEWKRLYPVPFRTLKSSQKFKKYQPMRLRVQDHSGDPRLETLRPDNDSLEVLGPPASSDHGWRARRPVVEPLIGGSMCSLQQSQKERGISLGMFRPRTVKDFLIEPLDLKEAKRLAAEAWANQGVLPGTGQDKAQTIAAIEQIPYRFKYRYACRHPQCRGRHEQMIVDWEIMEYFRRVRHKPNWEARIRERWLDELCGPHRDTAFIVGNARRYQNAFMILGVWWPPKEPEQLAL